MLKENEFIELKRQLTKDIKKEIVAFANSNGGTIYVGIDDTDSKVVGLKNANKDLEAVGCMIRDAIKPDLTMYTTLFIETIEAVDVLIIKVISAPNKPYYLAEKGMKPSGVYIRHGSSSTPATEERIRKLLLDNTSRNFEDLVSYNQDLHFQYADKAFSNKNIKFDKTKHRSLHIINSDNLYTNLGLFLSDECPYSIKVAVYHGNDKTAFKDRKEFSGSMIKQVDDVSSYLDLINKVEGRIVGLERIDTKDYPDFALRESLLNAVIHRDYNFNGSIMISIFDSNCKILSLGSLINGISLKDIYKGVSETRNPNLANIFFRLNYVECYGTGIARIIKSYDDYDLKPVFEESENTFLVTLPNINYEDKETLILPESLSQEEKIMVYLQEHKKISRYGVEQLLNVSKTRAIDILNQMVKSKNVYKQGTSSATYYTLDE